MIGNLRMHRRVLGSVPNPMTHKAPCSVYVATRNRVVFGAADLPALQAALGVPDRLQP